MSAAEVRREAWLRDVLDKADRDEDAFEDLDSLGYLHVVNNKDKSHAQVFVVGKHVRPVVHDRERILRHMMREIARLVGEERDIQVIYVNTLASPFENSRASQCGERKLIQERREQTH